MSAFRKRTAVLAGLGTLIAGLTLPVAAAPAYASTATNYRFNAVGSDTIFCEDNAVATKFNNAQAKSGKSGNEMENTPPVLDYPLGCETSPSSFTVPKDSVHGKISYKCNLKNTSLSSALSTSGPITSLPVAATGAALQAGKAVTLVSGSNRQGFTVSSAVAQGSTSIPVDSQTPNSAYPVGTAVDAPDCIPGDGATGNLPADGSTAGIAALIADNGAGNIAYARSSAGRTSSNPSNIDFWAFALDAVSWASFPGTVAPANLTATDITDIYNCTYTDWSQVPGSSGSGTIQRYFPQPGSGTGKFFATLFLGGVYPSDTGSCPVTYSEENQGTQLTQLPGFNAATAIFPYSLAVHTAQTNGEEGSGNTLTGGAQLGEINGVAPSSSTLSESSAQTNISGDACSAQTTDFCASRYVYHVTDQRLVANNPAYGKAVLELVGVYYAGSGSPVAKGYCSDKYSSQISAYGFKPLGNGPTAQSTSGDPVPGDSYCRQF